MVRAQPKAGAAELGKVFGKGSIVMATGMEGDYIRYGGFPPVFVVVGCGGCSGSRGRRRNVLFAVQ